MTGYEEYYQDGMKCNGLQHDNMIWNVIGVNESDWDGKEMNGLQWEGFSRKHDGRR